MPKTTHKPSKAEPEAVPEVFRKIVEELGSEAQAKLYLRNFFADPSNIEAFSMLFEDYVPDYPPEFHRQIYDLIVDLEGNKAGAAPRGFAKSTVLDLVFLAWVALHVKRRFPILISDTFTQATMLLEPLKSELEQNELITWIYGKTAGETWATDDIIVYGIDDAGERKPVRILAKGAGMKIRGLRFLNFRPDLILIDDLENDEAVESEDRRRKLRNWLVRSVMPAMAKDGRYKGLIVMIGTVLHTESLLNTILQRKDEFASWQTLLFSGITEDESGKPASLWPERFSLEELIAWRDDPTHPDYIGVVAFASEIQNKPMAESERIIKAEWLTKRFNLVKVLNEYWESHRELGRDQLLRAWLKDTFRLVIGAVDPAISEKQTADYWAMVTIGIDKEGKIWILNVFRMREGDPKKQVLKILEEYAFWRHDKIKIESVAYQRGLYTLAKNEGAKLGLYPPTSASTPDKDKRRRAVIHSANFSGGLVLLREDMPLLSAFVDEVTGFPQAAHDDMFDAYMTAAEDAVIKSRPRTYSNKPAGF